MPIDVNNICNIAALDDIENEIIDSINEVVIPNFNAGQKTPWWTDAINMAIVNLGKRKGFVPYCSSIRLKEYHEWLFDICWSIEDNDIEGWKNFKGLKLICELEWYGNNSVLSDFMKLTVGVADYRVMIVQYYEDGPNKDHGTFLDILNICYSASDYQNRNFHYLLIGIPWVEPNNLKFYSWRK